MENTITTEEQEYVEHNVEYNEPETCKEDPYEKIKSSVDIKSIAQMNKSNESNITSVPSNGDLNTDFEKYQKEIEVRGTHKKMKPVFVTDSSVSELSCDKKLDLEKILSK